MNGKFPLGHTVITANARDSLQLEDVHQAMARHVTGDWGNLSEEDKQANGTALKEGLRLLSSYVDRNGTKFWIITEGDRSLTTVLLPDDY